VVVPAFTLSPLASAGEINAAAISMDLDDALAEQVFDQVEDGAGLTLQEAADRGNSC
jgi:hypothetical protein